MKNVSKSLWKEIRSMNTSFKNALKPPVINETSDLGGAFADYDCNPKGGGVFSLEVLTVSESDRVGIPKKTTRDNG